MVGAKNQGKQVQEGWKEEKMASLKYMFAKFREEDQNQIKA